MSRLTGSHIGWHEWLHFVLYTLSYFDRTNTILLVFLTTLRIKFETFWCRGQCSNWATLARAATMILKLNIHLLLVPTLLNVILCSNSHTFNFCMLFFLNPRLAEIGDLNDGITWCFTLLKSQWEITIYLNLCIYVYGIWGILFKRDQIKQTPYLFKKMIMIEDYPTVMRRNSES